MTHVLNDINVTITGRRVRIDVLLDAKGLDKLRDWIDALKTLIEDESGPDDERRTVLGGSNAPPPVNAEGP